MHFRYFRGKDRRASRTRPRKSSRSCSTRAGSRGTTSRTTFTLEAAADGTVHQAIRPDFYLPELGSYIECTVMKQANTNKKNQKVRKLREQYGEVVMLFYRRDFQRLRRKYRATSTSQTNPVPRSHQ